MENMTRLLTEEPNLSELQKLLTLEREGSPV